MSATAIPIIWLAIALVGLALAIYSLIESTTDYMTTRPTNGFRALALGDIISESLRVLLYLVFAGIGVYYISHPVIGITRPGVATFMVIGELIIVAKTVVQIVVRRYIRATHGRIVGVPETDNQKDDREHGDIRRDEEANGA